MRTNIDIDHDLLARAQALSGSKSERETIERALTLVVQLGEQAEVRRLRGQLGWDGDLDASRTDR